MANWQNLADRVIKTGISTFGREVRYHALNDEPVEINGIFDETFATVDPNTGAVIDSSTPVLHVRLADLPCTPSPGDRVCIGEAVYRVVSHQPDGQGASMLVLHKL